MIQVGQQAPAFALEGVLDGAFVDVKLSDYAGSWVVLFFYPLDFTFVCPTEIKGFSARVAEFEALGAKVIGCSVDSKFSHLAWSERDFGKLGFPLLSDIRREATDAYGVLLQDQGVALRGTFIILTGLGLLVFALALKRISIVLKKIHPAPAPVVLTVAATPRVLTWKVVAP